MPAQQIASLLASGTEILYALGLGDRVVAISHECDFPPEIAGRPRVTKAFIDATKPSDDIDRQVRERTVRGEPLYGIDAPLLASLRPDLIVTQEHCEVCAVSTRDLQGICEANPILRGVATVALNPHDLVSIFDDVLNVGRAAGIGERGVRFVDGLSKRVDAVRDRGGEVPRDRRPRVVCIEWIDPTMVAANWVPELIELAGGRCDLVRAGERSTFTPWSDIVAFDPEVIVVAPCGFDVERTLREFEKLRERERWSELSAVRRNRVFIADGNGLFNRSGPRVIDSLELIAHLLRDSQEPVPAQFSPYLRRVSV